MSPTSPRWPRIARRLAALGALLLAAACRDNPVAPAAPASLTPTAASPAALLVPCRPSATRPCPPPPDVYVKVVGADQHTCALRSTGLARCWGIAIYKEVLAGNQSFNELATFRLRDIDTDVDHACAVDTSYQGWCWGLNGSGQLGSGTVYDAATSTPRLVSGGHLFTKIATGASHSCAIDTAGLVWCWGRDDLGQLGDGMGGSPGLVSVTPVNARLSTGTAVAIDLGNDHSCALTSAQVVECWGRNDDGEAGRFLNAASGSTICTIAYAVTAWCVLAPTPVMMNSITGFWNQGIVTIAAGAHRSCAITSGGQLFCWGGAPLGNGTRDVSPSPIPIDGGNPYRSVAIGSGHDCAIRTSGPAYCWGDNRFGQLGFEAQVHTPESLLPVPVLTPPAAYASAGLGDLHSCAITDDKLSLYCWGEKQSFNWYMSGGSGYSPPVLVTVF